MRFIPLCLSVVPGAWWLAFMCQAMTMRAKRAFSQCSDSNLEVGKMDCRVLLEQWTA